MLRTKNQKKMCLDGLYRINKKPLILNLKPEKKKAVFSGKVSIDGIRVAPRYGEFFPAKSDWRTERKHIKEEEKEKFFPNILERFSRGMTIVRMWNVSIVGSVIFGMFLMTMIYRYLGQSARADEPRIVIYPNQQKSIEETVEKSAPPYVLGEETENPPKEKGKDYAEKIISENKERSHRNQEKKELEKEIRKMTKGYPIEKMAPYIAEKDRTTAAFFVAMAKKESNWGKNVPVLAGQDCFNYLGYKGIRARMGSGGHTCFDSVQDAVDTMTKRIDYLVKEEKITTPEKMVTVWKCGYDCSWDDPAAVKKWVSDVKMYFDELKPQKR